MTTIREVDAFYPSFSIGGEPMAIPCTLRIVECNGKRYFKTPFAMLDSYDEQDIERALERGFYRTETDCKAYLEREYPHWQAAEPIMTALANAIRWSSICGPGDVADRCNVTLDQIHRIARGSRSFSLKSVRAAVKSLKASTSKMRV